MKKTITLLLIALILTSLTACSSNHENSAGEDQNGSSVIIPSVEEDTMGAALWNTFQETLTENPEISMEELSNTIIQNPVIEFAGIATPLEVDAEYFPGFDEYCITGYESAASFGPIIGSIAFIGYVFDLDDNTDVNEFVTSLTDNCNPDWNICVSAEQTVAGAMDDKVFFVMCPSGNN